MALQVKGQWVAWSNVTVDEIRSQIALGVITKKDLRILLKAHKLNNEVSGWAYKLLNTAVDENNFKGLTVGPDKFLFDMSDVKKD